MTGNLPGQESAAPRAHRAPRCHGPRPARAHRRDARGARPWSRFPSSPARAQRAHDHGDRERAGRRRGFIERAARRGQGRDRAAAHHARAAPSRAARRARYGARPRARRLGHPRARPGCAAPQAVDLSEVDFALVPALADRPARATAWATARATSTASLAGRGARPHCAHPRCRRASPSCSSNVPRDAHRRAGGSPRDLATRRERGDHRRQGDRGVVARGALHPRGASCRARRRPGARGHHRG